MEGGPLYSVPMQAFDMLVDRISDVEDRLANIEGRLHRLHQERLEAFEYAPVGSTLPGWDYVGRRCPIVKHFDRADPGHLMAVTWDGDLLKGPLIQRFKIVRPVDASCIGWQLVFESERDEAVARNALGEDVFVAVREKLRAASGMIVPACGEYDTDDDYELDIPFKIEGCCPRVRELLKGCLNFELVCILLKHENPGVVDIGAYGLTMRWTGNLAEILQTCEKIASTAQRSTPFRYYHVYRVERGLEIMAGPDLRCDFDRVEDIAKSFRPDDDAYKTFQRARRDEHSLFYFS